MRQIAIPQLQVCGFLPAQGIDRRLDSLELAHVVGRHFAVRVLVVQRLDPRFQLAQFL